MLKTNLQKNKIGLCRLLSPLGKDKTLRDGLSPSVVILPLNHYSFSKTMYQVLLSWTPLTELNK